MSDNRKQTNAAAESEVLKTLEELHKKWREIRGGALVLPKIAAGGDDDPLDYPYGGRPLGDGDAPGRESPPLFPDFPYGDPVPQGDWGSRHREAPPAFPDFPYGDPGSRA